MSWEASRWRVALETKLVRGIPKDTMLKRTEMINEAIRLDGSLSEPKQHVIAEKENITLLFEKPGKEAIAGTNVNDMRPMVLVNGRPLDPPSFSFIWSDLTNIAMADFEAFKAVLLLIYRSAFLLDHIKTDAHGWRYCPRDGVSDAIDELDRTVGDRTEFGNVWGLLGFIDLLGWNEDVKYHSVGGSASFTEGKYGGKGKQKIGRINTLLSCIRVPYEISDFMYSHREEIMGGKKADFVSLYDIMQALINSRGLCTPKRNEDLLRFLDPYLVEESKITLGRRLSNELTQGQQTLQ